MSYLAVIIPLFFSIPYHGMLHHSVMTSTSSHATHDGLSTVSMRR